MHTIILTTLPRGRVGGDSGRTRYRWSLYVSLRLEPGVTGATLRECAPFDDWPAMLENARFMLDFRADGDTELQSVEVTPLDLPSSRYWRALFHPALPVFPFDSGEPEQVQEVLAYDQGVLVRWLRGNYLRALTEPPLLAQPALDHLRANGRPRQPASGVKRTLSELVKAWKGTGTPTEIEAQLARFQLFHEGIRSGARRLNDTDRPTDFHKGLSAVQDYPELMDKLGLVLNFELDEASAKLPAQGLVRSRVAFEQPPPSETDSASTRVCVPWTAFESIDHPDAQVAVFHPRPSPEATNGQRVVSGMLQLETDAVVFSQEQPVNALLAMAHYDQRLAHAAGGKANERLESEDLLPPALFSGGISLLDSRSATDLEHALARRPELEQWLAAERDAAGAPEQILYASDVIQGFRIDVRRGDGCWRSLCERTVEYTIGRGTDAIKVPACQDEGTVSLVAEQHVQDNLTVFRSTTSLFEWKGWSLVLPRPGKHLGEDGQPQSDSIAPDENFPLSVTSDVTPGSLERQRFGEAYQFRARAVDLAGHAWNVAEADGIAPAGGNRFVSKPVPCVRLEQLAPPLLVPALKPGLGDGPKSLAINNAQTPAAMTLKPRGKIFIMPPRVAQELAERHGVFDDLSPAQSWSLITESQRAVPEEWDAALVKALEAGDQLRVPYLSDPLASGVVLRDLPGASGPLTVPFGVHGTRVTSVSLTLAAGTGAPRRDQGNVTVFLPPGESRTIEIACIPKAGDVGKFAWASLRNDRPGRAGGDKQLARRVRDGEVPLIAPTRRLRLVHAAAAPPAPPAFDDPRIVRELEGRAVELIDPGFAVHPASTSRVDVEARWEDDVDDPSQPAFTKRKGSLYAFAVNVGEQDNQPLKSPPKRADGGPLTRHEFPDTRYHEVDYRAVATSRYSAFYPDAADPASRTVTSAPCRVRVPNSLPPAPPTPSYVVPTFEWSEETEVKDGQLVTVRTRSMGGLRVYLERGWFSSGNGERLAVALAPEDSNDPPDALLPYLTRWGCNPIKATAAAPLPACPDIGDLLDREHDTLGPLKPPRAWELVGEAAEWPLMFALYDVRLEPERGLLYVDLQMKARAHFMPFVQLVLARYQANSLAGAAFSKPATAALAQLVPKRTLSIKRTAQSVELTLEGRSYRDGLPRPATSVVFAYREKRDPQPRREPELGWHRDGEPIELEVKGDDNGWITWHAAVPCERTGPDARVVVKEYALFDTDASVAAPDEPLDPERDGRLVFVDWATL